MKILALLFITFISLTLFSQTNINVTNENVFEGEPYLAIDPNNQQHLVSAWMGFKLGEGIVIKTSYSDNGGNTWSTPINFSHQLVGNSSADVSLAYDNAGNLYACYIDYDNTNYLSGAIYVSKSTDGGTSWGTPSEAINISDCPNQLCLDRPWMVVDPSGNVFVTSMNPDQPTLVVPPYHPYVAVSTDQGASFNTPSTLDNTGFLAGSLISQPMPSPAIGSDGTFYAAYPSYETSQSLYAHIYIAKSIDAGNTFTYSSAYAGAGSGSTDPLPKKASLLIANPTNPNHLAIISVFDAEGDLDIYLSETTDGTNWSSLERINQDGIANGKTQDLVWADFNENGDLAICWRDRRNSSANGYQTETEIYAAIRFASSSIFETDFAISSQQVNHDVVLNGSGNDFMNVNFIGDTLYTVWGDVRTGTLNIFLNKANVLDGTSSIQTISQENGIINLYPNPSSDFINIENFSEVSEIKLINEKGQTVIDVNKKKTDISSLSRGNYLLVYKYKNKVVSSKFQKK